MPKITVQYTITTYLTLFEKQGLLYQEFQSWDRQKTKAMRKKASEIFSGITDSGPSGESLRTRPIKDAATGEALRGIIQEQICRMQRKSNEEYLIANDYFDYLRFRYKVDIPPFRRQLTALERQLSIAKDLHDFNAARRFDREEVAEKYLVSEKTIENDMKALRDGISVMDQKLSLSDFRLRNRKVTAVSTMHPLFLAQNLTQIVCLLEGLRKMEESSWTLQSYAKASAVSIWLQLSDYARKRILETLVGLMDLDCSWYETLDREAGRRPEKMFYNEVESGRGFGLLLYAFKGHIPCSICYISPEETSCNINGIITRIDGDMVWIRPESEDTATGIEKDHILEIEVATELR